MGAPIYGKGLPGAGGLVDFATLSPRPSPNEYLAAPEELVPAFPAGPGGGGGPRRGPAREYGIPAADLEEAFLAMVEELYTLKDYAKPTLSRAGERRFVFVQRTPRLRFPDVINVQFLPRGNDRSTLVLHSSSVFGVDDLGKNRERVTEWLARLDDAVADAEASAASAPAPDAPTDLANPMGSVIDSGVGDGDGGGGGGSTDSSVGSVGSVGDISDGGSFDSGSSESNSSSSSSSSSSNSNGSSGNGATSSPASGSAADRDGAVESNKEQQNPNPQGEGDSWAPWVSPPPGP